MTNLAFTGPRKLTYAQGTKIEKTLTEVMTKNWGEDWHTYHVGCASGCDMTVRCHLVGLNHRPIIYLAEGKQSWQLVKRSKRMIDECWSLGNAKLIAFPNKKCPDGVKPGKQFKGCGSGTWGTIAYAKWLGMPIEIVWLEDGLSQPDWMMSEQMSLL